MKGTPVIPEACERTDLTGHLKKMRVVVHV